MRLPVDSDMAGQENVGAGLLGNFFKSLRLFAPRFHCGDFVRKILNSISVYERSPAAVKRANVFLSSVFDR